MNVQLLRSTNPTIKQRRLPFETVALVLEGGGVLGAPIDSSNEHLHRPNKGHWNKAAAKQIILELTLDRF
jgi:hypothetical protein